MFFKAETFSNVDGFKPFRNLLCLCNKQNELKTDTVTISEVDGSSLNVHGSQLFCLSSSEKKTFIVSETDFLEIPYASWLNTIEGNSILVYQYDPATRVFAIFIYNFSKTEIEQVLQRVSLWDVYRDRDNIILTSFAKTVLESFSLLSKQYQWETDLSDYGEIRRIIGVFNNNLWVLLCNSGVSKNENVLICLNNCTGQIFLELNERSMLSDYFIKLLNPYGTILSLYGKCSSQPADSPFVEIDAESGEIVRSGRIESLYKENLKIGLWEVYDNRIYFTANKNSLTGTHIGVLDYKTLDLLWVEEVTDRKGTFKDLQVDKNKVYVLDMGGNLHTYEREKV